MQWKDLTRDNHTPPASEVLCLFRITHVLIRCSATVIHATVALRRASRPGKLEIQAAALRIAGVVKRMARTALSDRAPRPLRVHFKAAPRLFRQAAAAFYRRVDVLGEESLEYVAGGRMP